MDTLIDHYFNQGECDPDLEVEISDTTAMGWENMGGLFLIFYWTIGVSAILLGLENLYFKGRPSGKGSGARRRGFC